MTDLDILIPFSAATTDAELEACLRGIAANTPVISFEVTLVVIPGPGERMRGLDDFKALTERAAPDLSWTVIEYGFEGITRNVMEGIKAVRASYVAVVPPTHAIDDPAWFGKLQMPFQRTPQCGLAFAADAADLRGTGAQPFLWAASSGPGRVVLSPRDTMVAIANVARLFDYPESLIWAAKSLGLVTYAIPGVRIDIANEPAHARPGQK